MDIQSLYEIYLRFPSIQTDSRKIQKNDLFFALKGPNFNGNDYAEKALEDGAAYAMVDEGNFKNEKIIVVDDVLKTLQNLAKHHREQFDIPFIAITGSNGKTTTKELMYTVLSAHFKTYTTEGNFNNHIGIPLTILKIKDDAEIAVIEMGANHLQEIAGYCAYAQPTHGIITNCGIAHLEGFGSEENVRKGKGELYDFLRANNGVAFAFDDYDYLHKMSKGIKEMYWYGTKNGNLMGEAINPGVFLNVFCLNDDALNIVRTQLVGDYNLPNVLCAISVGKYFEVAEHEIKSAIESYVPSNSRSQLIQQGSNNIILDAYNANPSSMKAAIENMAFLAAEQKVLILGGMKEMGAASQTEHERVISLINKYQWKSVMLVGKEFQPFVKKYQWFDNVEKAKDWFKKQKFENCTILIKASRGIALEKILG